MKTVITSFNNMHHTAYRLLMLCLNLILLSLLFLCIYILTISKNVLFSLWIQRIYIGECALSAMILSFGGAFLLDYAEKTKE